MASVGGKRLLAEQTSSKANAQPPAKKGRKPKVPAEVKLQPIKKMVNDHVKTSSRMVNADWHDGYKEQGEELAGYLSDLRAPFQAVYDVGIVQNTAHGACHDVLMCIADSWENMNSVPMRGEVADTVSNMDTCKLEIKLTKWGEDFTKTFCASVSAPLSYMWRLLLQSAAGNADCKEEDLLQYIKDATDYKIELLDGSDPDDDNEELVITEVDAHAKAGTSVLSSCMRRRTSGRAFLRTTRCTKRSVQSIANLTGRST